MIEKALSIRLHIHEDTLPGSVIKSSVESFVDMLESISSDFGSEGKWLYSLESGSAAIRAYPDVSMDEDQQKAIVSDVFYLLADFEKGVIPDHVSNKTEESYKKLSLSLSSLGEKSIKSSIEISDKESAEPRIIDLKPFFEKDEPAVAVFKSIGSIEGVVKGIHAAKDQFIDVYDDFTKKRIKVYVDKIDDSTIGNSFKKRVRAAGLIEYDDKGFKRSMEASSLKVMPAPQDVPDFADLRGIMEC